MSAKRPACSKPPCSRDHCLSYFNRESVVVREEFVRSKYFRLLLKRSRSLCYARPRKISFSAIVSSHFSGILIPFDVKRRTFLSIFDFPLFAVFMTSDSVLCTKRILLYRCMYMKMLSSLRATKNTTKHDDTRKAGY